MHVSEELLVVFDTDCVMCSAWVYFILRHERAPTAKFISAWSEDGLALAARHMLAPEDLDTTYLVVVKGQPLLKSDATIAILNTLNAPWCWAAALRFIPKPVRDWCYDRMANNRYRWFARQEQCFLPPQGQETRFIQGRTRTAVSSDHR
ncbi:hypothetical protein BFP70_18960 [Thioclava sp. SK-1]|uniref:thiol-disulfide oxidoreductase DCC family protein n=1 Tax=Thioclava sp. SK-1 TaxID=1889770 RepID=UPI000824C32C|nr:hypothetical protein BFP70_18960 [Thioclava sp. SK-1]